MKTRYAITLCLCAALLLSPLSSCSGSPGSETDTSAATAPQEIITAEPGTGSAGDSEYESDRLPAGLNLGGRTVRVLAVYERKTDTVKDDELNASVVSRQTSVEKRLNVTIESGQSDYTRVTQAGYADRLETAAASGDSSYDILVQDRGTLGYCALKGLLSDLALLGYPDTAAPWWPGNQSESSALNGKLYVVCGDASLSATQDSCCIFANASLAQAAGYTDLPGLVSSMGWTTAKLLEMNSEAKLPDNADGSSKYFMTYSNSSLFDAVFCGAGFSFIENTGGVSRVSSGLGTDSFADLFDGYVKLLGGYTVATRSAAAENGFTSGNSLFQLGYMSDLEIMIINPSFKVILMPMPLLDSEQQTYRTTVSVNASGFAVTSACTDKTAAGQVLEALASYGYLNTRDAYYKTVFSGDNLSFRSNLEAFALLHDTLVFDPAAAYCSDSVMRSSFRKVTDKSSVWSSIYQSSIDGWTAAVDSLK